MFVERLIKFLSVVVVIFLLGYGAYLSFSIFFWNGVYNEVPLKEKTITIVNNDTGKENKIVYKKQALKGDPFVFLLLGVDTNDMSTGRSDTIMVSIVEPKSQKLTLLSVPRDTYMMNKKRGRLDKITHTHNDGAENTISSLEDYFNIPIDYYAEVNFDGFRKAIDAMGGIEINVPKKIYFFDRITMKYFRINPGKQKMDGLTALNYARYRGDVDGDFGRNRRQREVIQALLNQSTDFQNLTKIKELTGIMESNFRTNVKSSSIPKLINQIGLGSNMKIETLQLTGTPGRRNGRSVVLVDDVEKQKIVSELHKRLGFKN